MTSATASSEAVSVSMRKVRIARMIAATRAKVQRLSRAPRPSQLGRTRSRVSHRLVRPRGDRIFGDLRVDAGAHVVAERLLHQAVFAAVKTDDCDDAAGFEQLGRDVEQALEVAEL